MEVLKFLVKDMNEKLKIFKNLICRRCYSYSVAGTCRCKGFNLFIEAVEIIKKSHEILAIQSSVYARNISMDFQKFLEKFCKEDMNRDEPIKIPIKKKIRCKISPYGDHE